MNQETTSNNTSKTTVYHSSGSQQDSPDHYLLNSGEPQLIGQGIDFLIEDFKDTSEHLRVTQHKIELPFQIYAGAGTLVISLMISTIDSSNSRTIASDLMNDLNLFILCLIFSFVSYLLFIYSLKAAILNGLYVNRLNYLRDLIYHFTGLITKERPLDGLLFTQKNLGGSKKSLKVGLNDLIPISLGISIVLLLAFSAFFGGRYLVTKLNLSSPYDLIYVGICILIIFFIGRFLMAKLHSIDEQIRLKIENLWPSKS